METETKKTILEWSLDRLCIDHPDYFQGADSDGYDEVFIGIGRSEKEAADDAAEQAAMAGCEIPEEIEKEISALSTEDEIEEIERDAFIDNVGSEPEPEYRIALYPFNGCGPIVLRDRMALVEANNVLSTMLDRAEKEGADVSDLVPSGDCAQGEVQYDGGVSDRDGILSVEESPESKGARRDFEKRAQWYENSGGCDAQLYFAMRVNFSETEGAP